MSPVFTNDTVANSISFNDTFGHNVQIGTYNPDWAMDFNRCCWRFTNLTCPQRSRGNDNDWADDSWRDHLGQRRVGWVWRIDVPSFPYHWWNASGSSFFTNYQRRERLALLANRPSRAAGAKVATLTKRVTDSLSGVVSGVGFQNYFLSPPR